MCSSTLCLICIRALIALATGCTLVQYLAITNEAQRDCWVLRFHHLLYAKHSLISTRVLVPIPPSSLLLHNLSHTLQWYLFLSS
uniref:Putative ovule protein n=1 Tax=Solanum chacoense TaxID=4108 RepID=A0A0V0GXV0_SOLCH